MYKYIALVTVFGFVIGFILFGFTLLIVSEEQKAEPYSAYADLSIFQDGNVNINFVRTHCIGSPDSIIWKCHADLVFNDRAVGFVNFEEQKQEKE